MKFSMWKMFTRFAVAKIDNQVFLSNVWVYHTFTKLWDHREFFSLQCICFFVQCWLLCIHARISDQNAGLYHVVVVSRMPTNPINEKAFFNYLIAHNYFMNKTNMDQETSAMKMSFSLRAQLSEGKKQRNCRELTSCRENGVKYHF